MILDSFPQAEPSSAAPKPQPHGIILLIGNDTLLQESRSTVLEKLGFRCHSLLGPVGPQDLTETYYIAAVLCHTLSHMEACRLARLLGRVTPLTPVLRLESLFQQRENCCFDLMLIDPPPRVLQRKVLSVSVTGILRRIRRLAEDKGAKAGA